MLGAIIIQLWNRKRSNLFLVLELLCVFCLVWYMTDYLFVYACNRSIPNHRDLNHVWLVNPAEYPPGYAGYRTEEEGAEAFLQNFNRILHTLDRYPGIEAVAVCSPASVPGSGSYWGMGLMSVQDTTKEIRGQRTGISPTEDFFRTFGYTRREGRQSVSMHDFDWDDPRAIVISRSAEQALFPQGTSAGQELMNPYNREERYKVVGVVDDVKRFDYLRPQHVWYLPFRLDTGMIRKDNDFAAILVRSKASIPDNVFKEDFMREMSIALQIGNFYLKSIVSINKIHEDTKSTFGVSNDIRIRLRLMAFFLLNILLCVLGTFRYRINTRREEIGIRKALGSSSGTIRNILLAEGLILLTVAAIPAIIIELNFVYAGLIDTLGKDGSIKETVYLPDRTYLRFLITNGITWLIMAAVIVAAIWLPARKAAALPAAEALHYE